MDKTENHKAEELKYDLTGKSGECAKELLMNTIVCADDLKQVVAMIRLAFAHGFLAGLDHGQKVAKQCLDATFAEMKKEK